MDVALSQPILCLLKSFPICACASRILVDRDCHAHQEFPWHFWSQMLVAACLSLIAVQAACASMSICSKYTICMLRLLKWDWWFSFPLHATFAAARPHCTICGMMTGMAILSMSHSTMKVNNRFLRDIQATQRRWSIYATENRSTLACWWDVYWILILVSLFGPSPKHRHMWCQVISPCRQNFFQEKYAEIAFLLAN